MTRKQRLYRWRISIQRTLFPPLVAWVGQALIHLTMLTCRLEVRGIENLHDVMKQRGCILMLWHNRMTIICHVLYRKARDYFYAAVVSNSRDGDLLAAIGDTYAHGSVIRVPHNARHRAVREMIRHLNDKVILLLTPDGPRGPAYTVRPGTAFVARTTDAAVVPLTWSASRFWQLPTWDRLIIPKPFSRVTVAFGEPIIPNTESKLEDVSEILKESLTDLDSYVCESITPDRSRWPR